MFRVITVTKIEVDSLTLRISRFLIPLWSFCFYNAIQSIKLILWIILLIFSLPANNNFSIFIRDIRNTCIFIGTSIIFLKLKFSTGQKFSIITFAYLIQCIRLIRTYLSGMLLFFPFGIRLGFVIFISCAFQCRTILYCYSTC